MSPKQTIDEPLNQCVKDAYYAVTRQKLSTSEVEHFVEGVLAYDGLFEEFLKNPKSVTSEIFSVDLTGHVVIPCYTIELRNILRSQMVISSYPIMGFPLETAKRFLNEYPVLLVFDPREFENETYLLDLNSVTVFGKELKIGHALTRVLAFGRMDNDNAADVERIVNEECPDIQFGVVTDTPGIASPKVAQGQPVMRPNLQKFIVNLPAMGITGHDGNGEPINSSDAQSALQEALDRKWKETGNPHKDPKFTADYWMSSPLVQSNPKAMEQLVHQANFATQIVKESQNSPQPMPPQPAMEVPAEKKKLKLPLQIEPEEQEVFDLLLKINQDFNLGLTFRVAGGWVRDRLLGIKSKDIDIALDKMTGAQFCKYVTQTTGRKPAIIAADKKKSKTLETATINLGNTVNDEGKIVGMPIDFVNLRKEVYDDNTRVPEMAFGTPEEDAERRDLTLNSLFYNVNAGKVEDLTGKGLEDLASLTLRTPLDPKQTFADDPLRVFRVLRFFAKFKGSKIADETLAAISDPEVQEALDPKNTIEVEVTDPKTGEVTTEIQRKISEERILTEWQKLHKGPQASAALRIAFESGLWNKVFVAGSHEFESDVPVAEEPVLDEQGQPVIDKKTGKPKTTVKYEKRKRNMVNEFHPFTMDQNNAWHVDNVFEHTIKVVDEYDKILQADGADDEERARALCAAFMHDLGKLDPTIIGQKEVEGIIRNTYHGHEDISALAAEAILKGIKSSNEEIDYIKAIVKNHMIPHDKMTDKQINKMIRNLGRSLVRRIVQHAKADAMSKPGADAEHYDKLLNRVQNSFAVDPQQVRPVVVGGIIMKLFPGLRPESGFIKEIQDRLQDMKDGYPQLTEQEALVEVENMRPEIEAKYKGYVVQKRQKQQPQQKPVQQPKAVVPSPIPPTTAMTSPFNSKKAGDNSTTRLLCGKVVKHSFGVGSKSEHQAVFIVTDEGEYKLRRSTGNAFNDPDLDKLVGKRVCGKGMIHDYLFIMSEYSIVNLDKDEEEIDLKRETPEEMSPFKEGDRVRHRQRGMAFEQIVGRIAKIKDDLLYVKWDGVADAEVFSLKDPVALFGILQKA